jgi:hypothetical protein
MMIRSQFGQRPFRTSGLAHDQTRARFLRASGAVPISINGALIQLPGAGGTAVTTR